MDWKMMKDDQEFSYKVGRKTDGNVEFLKELSGNDEFWVFNQNREELDAPIMILSIQPRVGLLEAKMIAEVFTAETKWVLLMAKIENPTANILQQPPCCLGLIMLQFLQHYSLP